MADSDSGMIDNSNSGKIDNSNKNNGLVIKNDTE